VTTTVLFVCAGNICRSPMAEAMFRHHAAFHAALGGVEVRSTGIIALDGNAATAYAIDAVRELAGLDLERHRARRLLTTDDADLVLTLDRWVHAHASRLGLRGRVELLGDYAGFPNEEVQDPYEGTMDDYRHAVRHVERLVRAAVARLARERSGFDLQAYLRRIGFTGSTHADLATLRLVQQAHVEAIPFENLDIQLGRPVRLDLASLQAKLVGQSRGGYCFEQNTVLVHALRALRFDAIACEARVRSDGSRVLPRTHMVLVITLDGQPWLCDAGFGGDGPIHPVPLDGREERQGLWSYRVAQEGALRVLQMQQGSWTDLYAFLPEPRYPVDFEAANWYTSTWPQSRFVLSLTAQRATPDVRIVLRNLTLTISDSRGTRTRDLARADLVPMLRDTFRLDIPTDARFRALDT
jgi:N-hydroxyarylamine O-acetyltransferase